MIKADEAKPQPIDIRDLLRGEVYAWAMDRTIELADQLTIGDVRDLVERLEKRIIAGRAP